MTASPPDAAPPSPAVEEPRLSVAAWLCLALYVLVATAGAFTGGLWAIAGIGSAILLFALTALQKGSRCLDIDRHFIVLISIALLTMLALGEVSIVPDLSWHMTSKLATIFVPLSLLSCTRVQANAAHPLFVPVVALSAAIGAVALGVELSSGTPLLAALKGAHASPTQYNRGLSYIVLLSFPLLGGILNSDDLALNRQQRWIFAVLFVALLLFPAGLTESRAAKLALVVGLLVTASARLWSHLVYRALAAGLFILPAWPFAAQTVFRTHYEWLRHLPDSWRARVEIWDYMSYRIMEHPWLGSGLGASHLLPFQEPDGARYVFTTIPAAHPHNVFTQLWVELGLPGLVLGLVFALMMLRRAAALRYDRRPFALGAFAAALCLSLVAYDFWTDSLFAAFALTAFAFALTGGRQGRPIY